VNLSRGSLGNARRDPEGAIVTRRELTADEVLRRQYECGALRLDGEHDYDRHLVFDHVVSLDDADQRERLEAVARSLRDLLSQRWLLTQQTQDRANPKRVYYLSMEFLLGRSLVNNIINLGVEGLVRKDLSSDPLQDWTEMVETEPDAGLRNGGLGRLAACFMDSLATMQIPATGYGLRYEYGIFRQEIENGWQVERPDHWLLRPRPST
jgi:glycogen phosphorylase